MATEADEGHEARKRAPTLHRRFGCLWSLSSPSYPISALHCSASSEKHGGAGPLPHLTAPKLRRNAFLRSVIFPSSPSRLPTSPSFVAVGRLVYVASFRHSPQSTCLRRVFPPVAPNLTLSVPAIAPHRFHVVNCTLMPNIEHKTSPVWLDSEDKGAFPVKHVSPERDSFQALLLATPKAPPCALTRRWPILFSFSVTSLNSPLGEP